MLPLTTELEELPARPKLMKAQTLMVSASTKSIIGAYPNAQGVTVTFPLSGLTKSTFFHPLGSHV
jgi:hypothetical protein